MAEAGTDFSGSRAVLCGTGKYAYLPAVPAALNSLARMRGVLTGGLCGWPEDRVSVFADEPRPGDLPDQLVELFGDAEDVALFYYVGHGQVDPWDTLCLGLAQSRTEASRRRTTSLPFDAVRYALTQSRARIKLVILDCCYAGLAAPAGLSAGDMADRTRGTGAYTLAAAGEFELAWFETDDGIDHPQTYFTKYLADVIEAGIPGQGPYLRLELIFRQAQERLAGAGKPVPTSRAAGNAPQMAFARNAAAETSGLEQPDHSRSTAILIGTSDYQDGKFASVPEIANSLNAFRQVLSDPGLCGWPEERIAIMENPVDATRVIQRIRRLAEQAEDALLVYYAGHSRVVRRGQLCLAISDTEFSDSDITGIDYERIAEALRDSPARARTVILDCDYSGRAAASEGPDYLLAATSANRQAVCLPGESCLAMTGRLVEVIRAGIPDGPATLTLSGICHELRRRLQQEGLPLPTLRSTETSSPAFFAFNAAVPGAR